MELSEQIARITQMEQALNIATAAVAALSDALEQYNAVRPQLHLLDDYYTNGQWMQDHDADSEGKLPADLPRGVLTEDAIYDLLCDVHTLQDDLRQALQEENA
jgi:hypothetical protein